MKTILKIYFFTAFYGIISTLYAEVITDGSLGNRVNLNAPDYQIRQELGKRLGNNLFHSFEKFNIYPDESAIFSGDDSIQNVIGRVTGGDSSTIDGTLRNTIPQANTYLINPAGIMFGANAQLDVQGSFHASTADYLRLGEKGLFHVNLSENSVLTVAPPSAFGFLSETPASISKTKSFLAVPNGKTLSFIGGDIIIQDNPITGEEKSSLSAPDGRINLVSVASTGEVPVNLKNLPNETLMQFGEIKILDAQIETSEAGGGNIYILGGQIVMKNANVWSNTHGNKNGQGIEITAKNGIIAQGTTSITADVIGGSSGKGGSIEMTAKQISLLNGAQIRTKTFGKGDAGNILIKVDKLILKDRAHLDMNTLGEGNAGSLTIEAKESVSVIGIKEQRQDTAITSNSFLSEMAGASGSITISAPVVEVKEGGLIQAATTGIGEAGSILLNVDTLRVSDGAELTTRTRGQGEGGTITINGGNIYLTNKGTISANSIGSGNAGDIILRLGNVLFMQNAAITTDTQNAEGGNIKISSQGYLHLTDDSKITTSAAASGNGGDIDLNPKFVILDNGRILAQAVEGNGGKVKIATLGIYNFAEGELEEFINAQSSGGGIDGIVEINSPDTETNLEIVVLPAKFFDASDQLQPSCNIRNNTGRFVVIHSDVFPPALDDAQSSPLLLIEGQKIGPENTYSASE